MVGPAKRPRSRNMSPSAIGAVLDEDSNTLLEANALASETMSTIHRKPLSFVIDTHIHTRLYESSHDTRALIESTTPSGALCEPARSTSGGMHRRHGTRY
jgi:hypothetical protein